MSPFPPSLSITSELRGISLSRKNIGLQIYGALGNTGKTWAWVEDKNVLKTRQGWLSPQPFCLAVPEGKDYGWLGRLLMHSSILLMAYSASCIPHI